jgi:hypothetical protein
MAATKPPCHRCDHTDYCDVVGVGDDCGCDSEHKGRCLMGNPPKLI